jgi:hypothetical protein
MDYLILCQILALLGLFVRLALPDNARGEKTNALMVWATVVAWTIGPVILLLPGVSDHDTQGMYLIITIPTGAVLALLALTAYDEARKHRM